MGAHPRVQVPLRAGHSEQSDAQLHEGDCMWRRSVDRKQCKLEREVSRGRSSPRQNPVWEKTEGEGPNEKERQRAWRCQR